MTCLRSRLRAIAALVVLCLSIGPAASALCPHPDGEAAHEMPMPADMASADMESAGMETSEMPPCHDAPAPETPESDDADCASPCCVAAAAPAPVLADAPTADVGLTLAAWSTDALPTATRAARVPVPPRAPPRHAFEPSVGLRV